MGGRHQGKAIRHRETELAALKRAGVAAFVLTAHGFTGEANGEVLVKALPAMGRYLLGNVPPFIASISATSRITMLYRGRRPRQRRPKRKRHKARRKALHDYFARQP